MKVEDLITYFGSAAKAAKALGLDRNSVYWWNSRGHIPYVQQIKYQNFTKGKLKATRDQFYFPAYRYYDDKNGMCDVKYICFNEHKKPRIRFQSNFNRARFISTDNLDNLMQASSLVDDDDVILYEKDIIFLNGEQVSFKALSNIHHFDYENDLQLNGFKIIGNIFEGINNGH